MVWNLGLCSVRKFGYNMWGMQSGQLSAPGGGGGRRYASIYSPGVVSPFFLKPDIRNRYEFAVPAAFGDVTYSIEIATQDERDNAIAFQILGIVSWSYL